MNRVLQGLLTKFVLNNGRKPNAIELLQLKFKAAQTGVDERKIISMFDRQPVDANQPIIGGQNLKKEFISETDEQILARLKKGNKESLSNMRYEKAVKAEEAKAAADEDYIMKVLDPEDFAEGGRAGLYQGGQAQIEPDLSDIGHGSDALMARNTLLTPGSQATTSTGLNYLLGEDNDTTRVPYKEKGSVSLSDFIKVQGSGSLSGKQDMYSTGEKSAIKLPEGITSNESFINFISTLDIPISEKISLLGDVQYTKFRNKIEKGDKELFLEDPSSYINKKVGIGVDSGTGITGSAKYDIDSGEPEFKIQFLKKFADGGRIPYGHGDMVLPKPKPMDEYMLKQVLSQAGANTLDPKTREMFIEMYKKKIREKNSKADGGPARQNFGMGKRAFLKWMASGAAGIAGLKSGILGVGKKEVAKSVIAPAAQAANEAAPAHFLKLLAKIKKLGNDVTETGALAERQKVKTYKDYTLTEDTTTGRIEIQKIKNEAGEDFGKDNFGNGLTEEVYMGYKPPETIVVKGKSIKTKPEYEEGTAYLRNDGPNTGDVYEEVSGVTDEVLKEVGESLIKKAEGGRIGYKFGKKVVGTVIKKAGEGKFTKNEVLLNMFENTIKATKDANTKTRFTNFIEEIKLKPELSKDPQVWNFFTKGLPKNQKLVVYGDDTVDFWTQSEFGPHNIATSAKFQKKHPYLTKDQAVKIQNMEPEDQIFEMKRLDAIRKRTANATGGRIGFSAGKGIMAIIKNLLKPKPKKLETVKDFVDKREFMKTIVGNSQKNKNKRILDEILEENKKVKGFEFKNLDVDKEIRPILDQSKNRTLNSSGGIAAMLGE